MNLNSINRRLFAPLFAAVLFLTFLRNSAEGASLQDTLKTMLKENFPDYNFMATPFGADSRFAVKTMWVYTNSFQRPGDSAGTGTSKGWVAFSDGRAIYPDELVKIRRETVTLSTITATNGKNLSLAASVLGTISDLESNAEIKASLERDYSLVVEIPEAEIEYSWYSDLLLSQDIYQSNVDLVTQSLKKRFGEVPTVRVISTALRVRNARITINKNGSIEASLAAKVATYLSNLGFGFSSKTGIAEKLVIGDWRYIAYEALIAKKGSITINTNDSIGEDAIKPEWNSNSSVRINLTPPGNPTGVNP